MGLDVNILLYMKMDSAMRLTPLDALYISKHLISGPDHSA